MASVPLSRYTVHLKDEIATEALASALATALVSGSEAVSSAERAVVTGHAASPAPVGGVVFLRGELGAGKTALCRGLLRGLGVTGRIKSPSYALLETYKVSNLYCYHLDFYRFNDPREWLEAGFRDLMRDDALVLIEWPEKAAGELPAPDLDISLNYSGLGRDVTLVALTERGQTWLNAIVPPDPLL